MDDPGLYGASFADVYDRWYPGGDEDELCEFVRTRVPAGSHLVELGVGTGRVALRLAGSDYRVTGVDSSPEMLERLAEKDPTRSVRSLQADAGGPAWHEAIGSGSADAVIAACNLLLNLVSDGAQQGCVLGAAEALRPGGLLVCELSRLGSPDDRRRRGPSTATARVGTDATTVVVESEADPLTGIVEGRHVETRDGRAVRGRPWRIRLLDPDGLDRLCARAGLVPRGRFAGWSSRVATASDPVVVAVYRRSGVGGSRVGLHRT